MVGNLLHLQGRPGLMPCSSPGIGVGGFPQTSALLKRIDLSSRCCINHGFHTGDYSLQGLTRKKNDDKDEELVFFA